MEGKKKKNGFGALKEVEKRLSLKKGKRRIPFENELLLLMRALDLQTKLVGSIGLGI